jgi:PAS domain S-box-containing protein
MKTPAREPTESSAALTGRERELERVSRLYAALSHINRATVRAKARADFLESICRALVEQGGLLMAWIGWHVPEARALVPVAQWGDETGYLQGIEVYTDDRPKGRGPSGMAFREGRPYISPDRLGDAANQPWSADIRGRRFRACAALPIRDNGQVQGALAVYAADAESFGELEVALLEEAAANISFGLENLSREQQRAQTEETLRQERDFSDAVINSLPGVFYLYDRDGKFLRWNERFERVSHYSAAEISALHPLDVMAAADRAEVSARITQTFTAGESSVEAGFLSKGGQVTPYYFTGVSTHIGGRLCLAGVGLDITERKRAEHECRASEARYRTLFEHAPDGIIIAAPSGHYIDANASACRMLGYSREELVGVHASAMVAPAEASYIEPALSTVASRAPYQREWQFRRKDGSLFSADVMATLMPEGNVMSVIRDVTERKRAEAAMRDLNESLERKVAERTEELSGAVARAEDADQIKSAFLAAMSHELRTPLNSIIGFTGIIQQGLAGPVNAEQSKQLGMVRSSARHLLELINDVLDLSKIEANQLEVRREPFDLRASLERVLGVVSPMADKAGLQLSAVIAPTIGQMVSDRRRVEQILLNLLNNAIKFTPRGSVTLSAELLDACGTVPPPRRAVRLRVADTGIGIRAEDLSLLFQPFRQLDTGLARHRDGTGLGLSICRRLAKLLGGDLTVTSEWAKGSEFTVILPLEEVTAP